MCIQNKRLYKNANRKDVREVDGTIGGTRKGLKFDNVLTAHSLNLQKKKYHKNFPIRNERPTAISPETRKKSYVSMLITKIQKCK